MPHLLRGMYPICCWHRIRWNHHGVRIRSGGTWSLSVIVGTAQITHVGVACIAQTVDLLCGCQVQSIVTEVGVTQCGKVGTVEAAVAVFVRVTRIYVSQVYIVLAELALPVDNII